MRQYSQLTLVTYRISQVLPIIYHIGSSIVLVTGLSLGSTLWIFLLYLSRVMATTSIYHRLLTHKSYQAPKLVLYLGCIVAASAGQMGPSWWKAHHLNHHYYTEQELDSHSPHTPFQGFWGFLWSHVGWLLSPRFLPKKLPNDVENDKVLRIIDRLHFLPFIALGAISYFIGGLEYLGAFFLSTTLLFHATQTVNSLAHIFGGQPFATEDQSRNNGLVAFLTVGEGWHNLHHAFQASSRHGITVQNGKVVYLPDPTFSFLKILELFGLASKLRVPTETELLARARHSNNLQPLNSGLPATEDA
ncbi:acyl-CoA desaturase [Nodosilinea sp. P-1105]|uniref:acyl-CoA desaturase n=1 Tax=Nodosilinea sp. P-1105 TaxID=2546229 RepID=UPI00146AA13B|nr:acyl-CoA desaturase [Nodosilinea sp. P-1105]NMF85155.1 acyl-CoA desaturase [Nodosilinea sp. P-1105]